MYADDIMVVIKARNRKEIEAKGQRAFDIICRWCKENKLEISIPKSGFIYLKGWLKDTKRNKIILEGERLQHLSDTKDFVTLSERLKVENHVLDVTSRRETKLQKLSRLSRNEWGFKSAAKLKLYRSIFIPKITYGTAAWYDLVGEKGRKKLISRQRKVLKSVTSAYSTVPTDALKVLCGQSSLDLELWEKVAAYCIRKGKDV